MWVKIFLYDFFILVTLLEFLFFKTMGQTFGKKKHFHVHTTLEPFSSYNIITK
jgi:hypothetical protein